LIQVGELDASGNEFWTGSRKEILWGWKRDVGDNSRTVFFSGLLDRDGDNIVLKRHYLFYQTSMTVKDARLIEPSIDAANSKLASDGLTASIERSNGNGKVRFRLEVGTATSEDEDKVVRLCRRRPRRAIKKGVFPEYTRVEESHKQLPADLYVGSGISYEAGLPTLCDMHDIFGVDSETAKHFSGGSDDPLPDLLAREGVDRIQKFCCTHTKAMNAEPTFAMKQIAKLQRDGVIGKVFTDNVDDLLIKVGVDFERVRGSGVFNERHPVEFLNKRLIVIGVAADRRQIVQQARGKRMKVTIVNPIAKVSPNVTHLDYVKDTDTFIKTTAEDFFRSLSRA